MVLPWRTACCGVFGRAGLQIHDVGHWPWEQYGAKTRRSWRNPHLAPDARSGDTIGNVMTEHCAGHASQVQTLIDQINVPTSIQHDPLP